MQEALNTGKAVFHAVSAKGLRKSKENSVSVKVRCVLLSIAHVHGMSLVFISILRSHSALGCSRKD